jgi:methylated-DNA-[protein]-cysteine S-methyltransferase
MSTNPNPGHVSTGASPRRTDRWHTVASTPIGDLTIVRDADAVVGLYFPHHWYRPQPAAFGPREPDGFGEVVTQLEEYLSGERRVFTAPLRAEGPAWQRRVWDLVNEVPYGATTTYGALAARTGDLDAKTVGVAVGRNPLCILVPCHRIVGHDGRLTGYAGGLARKRHLLDLERAAALPFQPTLGFEGAAAPLPFQLTLDLDLSAPR